MKKILLVIFIISSIKIFAQEGIHYQWHRDAMASSYCNNQNDTIYHLAKIANVSNYNAFVAIDIKNEKWSYLTSPLFNYNSLTTAKLFMKDYNNGLILLASSQVSVTVDRWQTANTYTNPATTIIEGVSTNGYYGYSANSGTFTTIFSSDGINWSSVYSGTTSPVFSKTKNKLYTIHNNLLKSSTNGGASYVSVNNTYTVSGKLLTPNDDTLFVVANDISYTFDGGANWSSYSLPTASVGQIAAKNGKELLIIDATGNPKNVYYTNNSGLSWTTYTTIPTTFSSEKLIANQTDFILYPNFKSSNGALWRDFLPMAPATKPYDISITNNVVLAAFAQGYFGYSLNKGQTFNYLSSTKVSTNFDLMAAKAIDENKFLAADRKGNIFVSTNQGQTWTQKTNSVNNNVPRKFSVSNDKNTIVLSALGAAYVSFDAANTFTFLNVSGGGAHYQTVKPTSGKVIDVTPLFPSPTFTLAGYEFYEYNGTNTKTLIGSIALNEDQDIIDVNMSDENTGYLMTRILSTNETRVYKTTNGWVNTATVSAIPTPSAGVRAYDGRYGNIYTFGTDTVIICGSGNPVNNTTNFYHVSTNGGVSWNIVYPTYSIPQNIFGNEIYKMAFFNTNESITLLSANICGSSQASSGVYLNINSSGLTPVGLNEMSKIPYEKNLTVYPNPANDNILLNFNSVLNQNISIKIFNIYGQMLDSMVLNSTAEPIDVTNLSTGIYFININIAGKTYTAKFLKN